MRHDRLSIRQATADDLAVLVTTETGPDTTRYLGVTGRDFHERALADVDQEQLVARIGATAVGFVVLAGLHTGGGRVELRRIVVSHGHRGAGYGRVLLRTAVERAFRLYGARQVWLDVKPDNDRARALYESEGFVADGTIPDPTEPDGVLVLMVRAADSTAIPTAQADHYSYR